MTKHFWMWCLLTVLVAVNSPLLAQSDPLTELLAGDESTQQSESDRVIETDSTDADDEKIRLRLNAIFSEFDDLKGIEVAVSNSVVTLSGETESVKAVGRAGSFAKQVAGVVDVENYVIVSTDVSRRIGNTFERLNSIAKSFLAALPMLTIAVVIVLIAWFIGGWLARKQTLTKRIAPNLFIADLLAKLTWIAITMLGVIVALSLLDATSIIGTVLGAAGIVGLAIGFAVKDTVENYISSILLSLRNPFLTRDYVAIGDIEGTVARLTSRATVLISADGNHIRIPNSTVFKAVIVNFTRNPQRRFEFSVGVGSDVDLAATQQLALDTLKNVPGVLDSPAGLAIIEELGDSSVVLVIRAWIDQRSHALAKVRSEAIRQIKLAFEDSGISMPEPAYSITFSPESAALINQPAQADMNTQEASVEPREKQGMQADPESDSEAIAQDTRVDKSVELTLNEEIESGDEENLLSGSAPHE